MITKTKICSVLITACIFINSCQQDSTITDAEVVPPQSALILNADTPIRIANGLITGKTGRADGILTYQGIPFANPPVEDLRWQPAQPHNNWDGVLAGDQYGAPCIQPSLPERTPNNRAVDMPDSPTMSEDCLYLNVWTPAKTATEKLPVMVWIYGGAYNEGAGSSPHSEGDQLATKGVIMVSFNYRLGSLGFLAHPELSSESSNNASGNYALSDALLALQWVQQNIAAFGGDPDNVTVFGESAGAAITSALVGSPLGRGLFSRAISESGTWMGLSIAPMRSRESAEQQTLQTTAELGIENITALRAMPAQEAFDTLPRQGMIIDGWIIPEDLSITFSEGRQNKVDVIVGSNRDEGSFASGFGPTMTVELWQETATQRWGELSALGLQAYPATTDNEASTHNDQLFTDNLAWISRLFANQQQKIGQNAYVYHFVHEPQYDTAARNLGVCHTCEMPYVFNNLGAVRVYPDASSPTLAINSDIDQQVADLSSSYWVNFAKTGNPNGPNLPHWPMFTSMSEGAVFHIGENSAIGDSLGQAKVNFYKALYDAQINPPPH